MLADRTWSEVDARVVVVPIGSLEQHGPHLPLDTDAQIAAAVAGLALRDNPSVVIAPPVAYGASGEHEGFAGTLSIGHDALRAVLVELGRSAVRWAPRLLFVNAHGGNLPTVAEAVAQLRREGRDAAWFGCAVDGGDAHAGRTETSIMLVLAPDLVRQDAMKVGNTAPLAELMPALRSGGVATASPNGVLGDPREASFAEGARVLTQLTDRLSAAVARWTPAPDGHL